MLTHRSGIGNGLKDFKGRKVKDISKICFGSKFEFFLEKFNSRNNFVNENRTGAKIRLVNVSI